MVSSQRVMGGMVRTRRIAAWFLITMPHIDAGGHPSPYKAPVFARWPIAAKFDMPPVEFCGNWLNLSAGV